MGKSAEQLNTTERACVTRCSTVEQEIHAPSTELVVIDTTIKKSKIPPGSSRDKKTRAKAKAKAKCRPAKKDGKKLPKVNQKSLPAPVSTPKPPTIRSKGSAPPSVRKPPTVRSSGQPVDKNVKPPKKTIDKGKLGKSPRKDSKVPPNTKSPKKGGPVAKKPARKVEPEDDEEDTFPRSDDDLGDQTQEPEMDEGETAKKKAHALYMRYWRSVNQSWALKC